MFACPVRPMVRSSGVDTRGGAGIGREDETLLRKSRSRTVNPPAPRGPCARDEPFPQETILLNAPAGVVRAIARLRPTTSERSTRANPFHPPALRAARLFRA